MGAAVSAMRESITGDDDNKKQAVKQQLDFLVNTANTKLDQWQAQMDAYVFFLMTHGRVVETIPYPAMHSRTKRQCPNDKSLVSVLCDGNEDTEWDSPKRYARGPQLELRLTMHLQAASGINEVVDGI